LTRWKAFMLNLFPCIVLIYQKWVHSKAWIEPRGAHKVPGAAVRYRMTSRDDPYPHRRASVSGEEGLTGNQNVSRWKIVPHGWQKQNSGGKLPEFKSYETVLEHAVSAVNTIIYFSNRQSCWCYTFWAPKS
jgi:hypothetical protein